MLINNVSTLYLYINIAPDTTNVKGIILMKTDFFALVHIVVLLQDTLFSHADLLIVTRLFWGSDSVFVYMHYLVILYTSLANT